MFKKSQPTTMEKAEPKKWLTVDDRKATVGKSSQEPSKNRLLNTTAIYRQGIKR